MTSSEKIRQSVADIDNIGVVKYPDPRLKEPTTEIETVDEDVKILANKMLEIMFANNGVGLAGPQVGVSVRLFVTSPAFDPSDVHIYINPKVISGDKPLTEEEGCLSFPNIYCKIKRNSRVKIQAIDLEGNTITEDLTGLAAKAYQHELDHLEGTLLVDRMSSIAKMVNRRALANLEESFEKETH